MAAEADEKVTNRNQFDPLTGLLRETFFYAWVQDKLPALEGQWCMVEVDIEHCKLFQEWNGEEKTRSLFARIGSILNAYAQRFDGLAGYRGHDEFSILLPYDDAVLNRLYDEVNEAIRTMSRAVGFRPMLGVCLVEKKKEKAAKLVNHAAIAAENGKGAGKERIWLYNAPERDLHTAEYILLSDFSKAIDNEEIFFNLQPLCRVSTKRIVGAEALARWTKRDGTMISPVVFVPILEKYGLIANLDQYIWESVYKWMADLLERGIEPVPVSVNVSQIDLEVIDVPEFFRALQQKYMLPPGLIKVEVTETACAQNAETIQDAIRRLHEMGFRVYMDDFGSGASSLNMLRTLNLDVIKMDAQFLRIREDDERKGVSIVEAVVNLTKNLALPTIVEGVETEEQVRFLSDLGCRYMQGFYFYRPMEREQFEVLLMDDKNVDRRGVMLKANQQMHVREFLDESIYSDAMLNNILGPVAFYRLKDKSVDIIRYNQQFYQMVGLETDELHRRMNRMDRYIHPEDRGKFFGLLRDAEMHRINGAVGAVRVYKPNGVLVWIRLHMYFLREDEQGRIFYGSSRDVTEQQFINVDIPGGYFRSTVDNGFEFQYISQGFEKLTGFTRSEIAARFDNRLINMIHPDDAERVQQETRELIEGRREEIHPYRLRRASGDYIYVADRSILTDRFGALCLQSVTIDVTAEILMRNCVELLSRTLTGTVLLVHRKEDALSYEVLTNGMKNRTGLGDDELVQSLADGRFFGWFEGERGKKEIRTREDAEAFLAELDGQYTLRINGTQRISLHIRSDRIEEGGQDAIFILVISG